MQHRGHLVLVGVTQDEAPLLHLGAPVVGRIGLHPRPLDAFGLEPCKHTDNRIPLTEILDQQKQ